MDDVARNGVGTVDDALCHFGTLFRQSMMIPEFIPDVEVGRRFVDNFVYIHLSTDTDKLNFLL